MANILLFLHLFVFLYNSYISLRFLNFLTNSSSLLLIFWPISSKIVLFLILGSETCLCFHNITIRYFVFLIFQLSQSSKFSSTLVCLSSSTSSFRIFLFSSVQNEFHSLKRNDLYKFIKLYIIHAFLLSYQFYFLTQCYLFPFIRTRPLSLTTTSHDSNKFPIVLTKKSINFSKT